MTFKDMGHLMTCLTTFVPHEEPPPDLKKNNLSISFSTSLSFKLQFEDWFNVTPQHNSIKNSVIFSFISHQKKFTLLNKK